ncbi:autotransporter assembly complex protein TamA [Glaciecola petra]|uniref:Autotransporter assembly complex family protein n=1 Tax=Glaciecola petra TaxID=3075602 RepID=A0ABU2ZP32_9ALTE|nr:autotransporter assembly complex family protein [Aestuariibacter sp. P117]MDT0593344.1 autotransporter assembly complex family protein [Aestuariibacter sp. P117]
MPSIFLCLFLCLGSLSVSSEATELTITGIEDDDIIENIEIFVQQVSLPVSEFAVDEYEQKIVKAADKAVQAFAYYNAEFVLTPIQFAEFNDDGKQEREEGEYPFSIAMNVTLNQAVVISKINLLHDISNTTLLPENLAKVLKQVSGLQNKILDHDEYSSLKNQLITFALLYGYFDFKFIDHKLNILSDENEQQSTATIEWEFILGKRHKFGEIVFLEDTRGQDIATGVRTFKTGEYFDQTKIGQFSVDMSSTGYFNNAIARANASRKEGLLVPVEVILDPKPKDIFNPGIGFSTDTGPRVSLSWDRPWVNLRGHSLGGELYVSEPEQFLEVDYRVPKENPLKDFLNYQVGYKLVDDNQTNSETITLAAQRQWGGKVDGDWDKIAFIKLQQESFEQGLQEKQTTRLVLPGFTFNRTRKDGDLFVNWGDYQQLTVEAGSKDFLSDIDFFKVIARTKWIRQFDRHRLVLRADAGAISTSDFSRVPSSLRFFAGGDQSIRGFGLNEVSDFRRIENERGEIDEDSDIELLGGKYLAVASIEYAYNVTENWRAAVFFDTGNASNEFAENLATGVGVGAHWLSPIGNVQIYVARGKSDFEERWDVHLIIGPGL